MASILNRNINKYEYNEVEHLNARQINEEEYLNNYHMLNNDVNAYKFVSGGVILWYHNNVLIKTLQEKNELPENGDYKVVFIHLCNLDVRKIKNKIYIDMNKYDKC